MACFRTFHFLSSHRDERWVCSPFTLIVASRRDIKNGLRQNLSFPFTLLAPIGVVSTCNGSTRVLQVKTNAVNKIANRFFCGLLISLQNIAFFQSQIAQFLQKSRGLLARSQQPADMEPNFAHF